MQQLSQRSLAKCWIWDGLKTFPANTFYLFVFFSFCLKIWGFQSVHSMPYYADGRTEDDIATPEIGALVAVKWL